MDKLNKNSIRSALMMFFSFTFANSLTVGIHEIGHAISIILFSDRSVSLTIHPYLSSYVSWRTTDELIGIVDAAGPLFNLTVSIIIFVIFWRFKRPVFLPLIMMAPVALFQEGFSSFMQVVLKQNGTDSMRIIESGVPQILILIVSLIFLFAGIISFVSLFPMFGIRKEYGAGRIFLIIFSAAGANMLIMLLFALGADRDEVMRSLILLSTIFLFSIIFTIVYKFTSLRISKSIPFFITNRKELLYAFLTALVPVSAGLVFFN